MSADYSYDRAAWQYDRSYAMPPEVAERVAWTIVEATQATRATRFLELGIGTGRIARPLIAWGHRVTGVDLSRRMMLRLRNALVADQHVAALQGDVRRLPFVDQSTDVVLVVHVLHLVAEWETVLQEARRVLTPAGALLHSWNRRDPASPTARLRRQWRSVVARYGESTRRPGATSADEVTAALRALGADVRHIDAAYWSDTVTPAMILRSIARRQFSDTWKVSDRVLAGAVAQTESWAVTAFGDLDAPLEESHRVTFEVARWPGGRPAGRVRVHDDIP